MLNKATKKVFAVSVMAAAISLAGCGGGEDRQAKYLTRAQEYFDAENFEKAKIEVKNVMQINPNNAEGRFLLGRLAEQEQNYRGAYGNFAAVIEQDPNHVEALNKLAAYHLMSKDTDGALEKVNKALEIDAKNADALATLASIHLANEESELAILKAQEALANEPGHIQATTVLSAIYAKDDPDMALKVIGDGIAKQDKDAALKMLKIRVLASQQKSDEVIATFNELMTDDPENLLYPYQLVSYHLQDKTKEEAVRKDLAEAVLRDQVQSKPDEDKVKLWLVEFLAKNREPAAGRATLEEFVTVSPDNFTLRDALGKIYMQGKEVDNAKALYQAPINKDPTSASAIEARTRLIEIAVLGNDRDSVESLLGDIFALEPENGYALLTRAKLKLAGNDLQAAIPDLRVVLKNDPENIEALALLARTHEQQGSSNLALDSYQKLLAVDPKNVAGLIGAGRLLIKQQEPDRAQKALEQALAVQAGNPEATRLLAGIYISQERWDDALSIAAKLTEQETTMALGYYLQGRTYLIQKDYQAATKVLKQSLEANPAIIESLRALASSYVALEQADKALSYVSKHVESHPDHAHAKELLAGLTAQSGNVGKAIEITQSLIADQPERISAYRLLVNLFRSENRVQDIEPVLKNGIEKAEETQALQLMLAEYYQGTENHEQAQASYEAVLASHPDNMVARNNLAVLLIDHFDNDSNLKRAAELALELAGTENPAFLDTAGWIQYKLGNYAQAVSLLQTAIKKGGNGSVYHYHLGMAYYKNNMNEQAKESLQVALGNEAEQFVGRDEAEKTLTTL
jgi:tetratricopeptide (TPR) repeat protein